MLNKTLNFLIKEKEENYKTKEIRNVYMDLNNIITNNHETKPYLTDKEGSFVGEQKEKIKS